MIEAIAESVTRAVRDRWAYVANKPLGNSPVAPVMFNPGGGKPRRPMCFPAEIVGRTNITGKYCAAAGDGWYAVISWYHWRAMWDDRSWRTPWTQPAVHTAEVDEDDPLFDCYVEDEPGWPHTYTYEGPDSISGDNKFNGWMAINTADYDYFRPYCRGEGHNCMPIDMLVIPTKPPKIVTMTIGMWLGSVWHNEEYIELMTAYAGAQSVSRHDQLVPYFHHYEAPRLQSC